MAGPLTIAEARARILERVVRLAAEPVALEESAGRVLAEPARAAADVPPFPSSAMDGFVVHAADTPGRLPVVARIAAGKPPPRALEPGEAMAIATGGAVPEGGDAVVPLEHASEENGTVTFDASARPGDHIRPRAGDTAAGGVVVPAGVRLAPVQLGALAAAGVSAVTCAMRPRVAVVTTGSELRPAGSALAAGEIYESNGVMLEAALSAAGALVERLQPVEDDLDAHRQAIGRGLELDLLVTSGGVSVGPHDIVRRASGELGVEEVFWGVSVRPGRPLAFGVRGRTLVFGLPGNPVSALVGTELFVRPAVLALQGATEPGPHFQPGRLAIATRRNPRRDELLRARSTVSAAGVVLTPVTGQESHMIVRAATADTLVLVPRGEGELPAGAAARYLRLD